MRSSSKIQLKTAFLQLNNSELENAWKVFVEWKQNLLKSKKMLQRHRWGIRKNTWANKAKLHVRWIFCLRFCSFSWILCSKSLNSTAMKLCVKKKQTGVSFFVGHRLAKWKNLKNCSNLKAVNFKDSRKLKLWNFLL